MQLIPPDEADLTLLQDRQVAVLGFGPMGAAHALNLRDSGVDVRVGAVADSRGAARAEVEGLLVVEPQEALAQVDVVVLPLEDGVQLATVRDAAAGALETGDMVLLTSSAGLVELPPAGWLPPGVDLVVLQTIGGAERTRSEYLDGRGVPCLAAVQTDATGVAWAVLTAYAQAVGSLRSGAIRSSVDDLARAAHVAGTRVHPEVFAVVERGFEALLAQGVAPEVAYLACLHDLKERVDAVYAGGLAAVYGPRGSTDDGALSRREAAGTAHQLEQVGREVRALMSWIR